uniref:M23 family metallopeptidase n=1 Tax=Pedobacter schmidteae TaxID=2201271 RepID=UPI0013CEB6E1|nr:M23 family metallopeptidase [Pedobacter schmidteae]
MKLTSGFGWRKHPVTGFSDFHKGIDLSATFEPVYSILSGRVSAQGFQPILGNFIRIEQDSLEIIYGHLSASLVVIGQQVSAGQLLGITGDSGRVTGPHLHLSVKFRGQFLHPLRFLYGLAINKTAFNNF